MFLVQLLSNPLRNRAFFGVKKLWARGLRRHRRLLGAIVRAVARFPHVSQQTCARQRFARQRQDDNSVRQQISKVREHENFVAPADSCAIVRDVNDCRERRNRKLFLLFTNRTIVANFTSCGGTFDVHSLATQTQLRLWPTRTTALGHFSKAADISLRRSTIMIGTKSFFVMRAENPSRRVINGER